MYIVLRSFKADARRSDKNIVVVVVVAAAAVWKECDAAKALPGLHHYDRAYRQVNSLYRTLYNFDLPGGGQRLLINKAAQ